MRLYDQPKYATCYIYVVRCREYIKVGGSVDPRARLQSLLKSKTAMPDSVKSAETSEMSLIGCRMGTTELEDCIHSRLWPVRARRGYEWYQWCGYTEDAVRNLGLRYEKRFDPRIPLRQARPADDPLPPLNPWPTYEGCDDTTL